jgi:hypothetical protein
VRATSVTPTEVQVSCPRRSSHAFPSFHLVPLPSSHLKSTFAGPYPLQNSACFSWTRTKELPCPDQIPYFQGHSTPTPLRTRLEFRTLHLLERVCRVIPSSPLTHELLDHYGWTILKEGKGVVGKQRSQIVSQTRGCGISVKAAVPSQRSGSLADAHDARTLGLSSKSVLLTISSFLVHSQVGDVVLAKIKGFPAWPGVVSRTGEPLSIQPLSSIPAL